MNLEELTVAMNLEQFISLVVAASMPLTILAWEFAKKMFNWCFKHTDK